jgi:hypothetical protein
MIRQENFVDFESELDWTLDMVTHEIQETNCRKVESGWVKLPLEKSTKYDQT